MIRPIEKQLNRIQEFDKGRQRKKIVILGAGMAGLTAAYELKRLGHEITVYEANDRVGGRAWTKRFNVTESNPDGDYHELGAMRFPIEHDYTRYYAQKVCGLKFREFINHHDDEDALYYFNGIVSEHADWETKLLPMLELTPAEITMIKEGPIPEYDSDGNSLKGKQLLNLLVYPLEQLKEEINNNRADIEALLGVGKMTMGIAELDKVSLGEYLKKYLKSDDALALIGCVTGLEVWWDKAVTSFIRDEIAAEERKRIQGVYQDKPSIEEIVGGTDKLPTVMLEKLKELEVNVLFQHSVFAIKNLGNEVEIGIKNEENESSFINCDYVICTLPFSVLRQIDLKGLSKGKMSAIRNLGYASSTKVLLHTKNRFWELNYDIKGGGSQTNLINRQVYYPSDNTETKMGASLTSFNAVYGQVQQFEFKKIKDNSRSRQPGVLVGSYSWGQDARRIGSLSREKRVEVVKKAVGNIHPEILESDMILDSASIWWDEYKFASGAFCFMSPGDFVGHYQNTIKSEGNLFFAGEHCSLDYGWIQGAIISSYNVMEELVQR